MVLANNHPFPAEEDVANAALDTIWAAAVGSKAGTTRSQLDLLIQCSTVDLAENTDLPVAFPQAPISDDVVSIRTVIDSMEIGLASPLPGLSYFFTFQSSPPWTTSCVGRFTKRGKKADHLD